MFFMRNKIRTQDFNTTALIFSAFHRSLMIYFLTPLVAAGAITKLEINNIEASLKKNMYGLRGDLSNDLI
jgi:hypothetical protein